VPERRVSNDDMIQKVLQASSPLLTDGQAESLETKLRALFRLAGASFRRHREPHELPRDFTLRAAREAMERAGLSPRDVDLLIYVGVGRGWLEPGMSHYFCDSLGLVNATCFDIVDACLSWMRALQIAQQFLASGVHRNVLVVNCEFNLSEHGAWAIGHPDELAYRFAQCTIGEAATATILSADVDGPTSVRPHFEFHTDASLHRLCKIPLPSILQYSSDERCPSLEPNVFFAYSSELFAAAQRMIHENFGRSLALRDRGVDILFGHSGSKTLVDRVAADYGFADRVVNIFAEYGNTVSASIPLAMVHAIEAGRLRRGMQMLQVVGSAGFSIGFGHLVF
jgi:3-oxoacyl-[acyl-carrier-protein] synthase III